jgi:hypothetical protein
LPITNIANSFVDSYFRGRLKTTSRFWLAVTALAI